MKTSTVFLCALLATSAVAFADDPAAQANASANSGTAVSAGPGSASASNSSASTASANANRAQAGAASSSEMNATLSKPVDARKAKPGDSVTATNDSDAKAADGTSIKRGSKLVGHVTKAHPLERSAAGSADAQSMLSIVFDKAILRDGRELPLNATIQALSEARSATSLDSDRGGVGMSAGGLGTGSTRGSAGGGLLRGATGPAAGGLGAAGGLAGGVGSGVSGAAGGMAGATVRSAGAVGGVTSSGALNAGSRGVFGIKGLELASSSAGGAEGSVITSSTRDVRLDGGTRMLLSNSTNGSTTASGAAQAVGSLSKSGTTNDFSKSAGAPPADHAEPKRQ
jgi:hypothetical protein